MKTVKQKEGTTVANCHFIGVQYDAKAIEAISLIATALIENAGALRNLSQVLNASNVKIEAMLKIE